MKFMGTIKFSSNLHFVRKNKVKTIPQYFGKIINLNLHTKYSFCPLTICVHSSFIIVCIYLLRIELFLGKWIVLYHVILELYNNVDFHSFANAFSLKLNHPVFSDFNYYYETSASIAEMRHKYNFFKFYFLF